MKKILFTLFLIFSLFSQVSLAQDSGGADDIIKNTQNDLMIVGAAGAGGAILGLSTLSFVDRPSKHIYNIWSGAAIGIISGVIFVAYNSAQRGSEELQASKNFNSSERLVWHHHQSSLSSFGAVKFRAPVFQLSF